MSLNSTKGGRSSANQEFTAVVLAGLGGGLIPFSNPENLPKALLPVANRALLSYPLSWIDRAGLSSSIILCVDAHEAAIGHWLKTSWKGSHRPLLIAASSEDEIVGSADAIRTLLGDKYRDKIRSDVIILSCDTICEIPPHEVLDFHRLSEASITAVFYRNHPPEVVTAPKKGSKTFTGYDGSSNSLLYTSPVADVDEEVELRTSMLWKYPRVNFTSALTDLHLYVCKRSILDLIGAQEAISRVNTDLLPLICKSQFQSLLRQKYNISNTVTAKIYIPPVPALTPTTTTTTTTSGNAAANGPDRFFCARVNTKQSFIDLNKHLLKFIPTESRLPASTTVGDRTTVGPDCALGADSTIDEKTTIKRSVVGNQVRMGKMCRVTNCVVMDGVEIRDGAKLENCVICVGVVVGEKATLRDCTVGGKVTVPEKADRKGEEMVVGGEISMGA